MTFSITTAANRVGMNPREVKRFIKFAVVGVIGAVVDFGTFNLLLNPVKAMLADPSQARSLVGSISFILAIISNFIWNRYWTYPDSRSKSIRRQFVQFFLVNLSGLIIRIPIVYFGTEPLITFAERFLTILPLSSVRLGENMAVMFAVGIVMFWNFFVNRYWTYNDVS